MNIWSVTPVGNKLHILLHILSASCVLDFRHGKKDHGPTDVILARSAVPYTAKYWFRPEHVFHSMWRVKT